MYTFSQEWTDEQGNRDIIDYGIRVPAWISDQYIPCVYTVDSIRCSGYASGSFMPAVTYQTALQVMNEHGNSILDYIESNYGYLPCDIKGMSWTGMACYWYSMAVEIWANSINEDLDPVEDYVGEEIGNDM